MAKVLLQLHCVTRPHWTVFGWVSMRKVYILSNVLSRVFASNAAQNSNGHAVNSLLLFAVIWISHSNEIKLALCMEWRLSAVCRCMAETASKIAWFYYIIAFQLMQINRQRFFFSFKTLKKAINWSCNSHRVRDWWRVLISCCIGHCSADI